MSVNKNKDNNDKTAKMNCVLNMARSCAKLISSHLIV